MCVCACARVCRHECVDMRVDMCEGTGVHTCASMRAGIFVDMYTYIHVDIFVEMFVSDKVNASAAPGDVLVIMPKPTIVFLWHARMSARMHACTRATLACTPRTRAMPHTHAMSCTHAMPRTHACMHARHMRELTARAHAHTQ